MISIIIMAFVILVTAFGNHDVFTQSDLTLVAPEQTRSNFRLRIQRNDSPDRDRIDTSIHYMILHQDFL